MAPENFQETPRRNASQNDETSSRLLQGANSAIDMKASACENTAHGTAETANCWVNAEAEWTQELHGAEKSFTRETPQERAARIDAQNKFSKFQNMESVSIDQIYMNEPNRGTLFQPAAAAARSEMVRDRTIELQNLAGNEQNGSIKDRISVASGDQNSYLSNLSKAIQQADGHLNARFKGLMDQLSPEGKSAARESERAWIAFRDAEFKHIDQHITGTDTAARIARSEAKLDIMQNRANTIGHQLDITTEANEQEPN